MATILEDNYYFFEELFEEPIGSKCEKNMEEGYEHEMSMWIKDKSIIKPTSDVIILKKLEPGIYTVDSDRNIGCFCKPLQVTSDELFVFSNSLTEKILQEINLFWGKENLYKENNLIHKRGILLEGYPGTGKSSIITQIAEAVIKQGGVVFIIPNFRGLEVYMQFIKYEFRKIQPETPVITILEDIDKYEDVEEELLDFLDGKFSINHHVVIATTNNTEEISDTLLRPSRLDVRIEILPPDEETRKEYFIFKKVDEDLIPELVRQSRDCSLADLKEIYVCIFLLDYTMEEAILKVKSPKSKKNYSFPGSGRGKMGL